MPKIEPSKTTPYAELLDSQDILRTSDVNFIAILLSQGFEAQGLDRSNPGRKFYLFERGKECKEVIDQHLIGKVFVNSLDFVNHQRNVRQLMKST